MAAVARLAAALTVAVVLPGAVVLAGAVVLSGAGMASSASAAEASPGRSERVQSASCEGSSGGRLASGCRALLARAWGLPEAPRATAANRGWEAVRGASFGGGTSVTLLLDAQQAHRIGLYHTTRPTLILRCRDGNTALYIATDDYLGVEPVPVSWRIDGAPTERARWKPSSNYQAAGLWQGRAAVPLIRRLAEGRQLLVRFERPNAPPLLSSFDLDGLAEHARGLAATCGWHL